MFSVTVSFIINVMNDTEEDNLEGPKIESLNIYAAYKI